MRIGPRSTSPGYHHGDLRAALLDATVELVRDVGLGAVTMRAVAKRVGVSEAAPYHHFANKADLLGGAAALAFGALGEAIEHEIQESRDQQRDPALGLAAGYVTFGLTRSGEYQLIFGRHISDLGLDTQADVVIAGGATITAATDALAESLARRGSRLSAEEAFPLVRAVLHGVVDLVLERELGSGVTLDDAVAMATRAVDALLDGLRS